jgi:hypothetical protein
VFGLDPNNVEAWTLEQVSTRGSLHFECTRCWKITEFKPEPLIEKFGEETTLGAIRRHMRFRRCRSRRARCSCFCVACEAIRRGAQRCLDGRRAALS